jgi:hypothetical protein
VTGAAIGTATVTIAAPGVFTLNAHGLSAGNTVYLTTTGALPTGLGTQRVYYVTSTSLTANTFTLATTNGGTAITTTGSQSGTHTVVRTGATTLAGPVTSYGQLTLHQVAFTGGGRLDVTSTGTVNDLDGPQFRTGMNLIVRMNNASDATLTGVAGGLDGAMLTIVRIGAGNVFLAHENAGSAAGNRFLNTLTSGNTPLSTGGYAVYVYDNASGRWRLVCHEQGGLITYTPSLTNITLGNGTVSGRYRVRGVEVRVDVIFTAGTTTSFAASPFRVSVPYTASSLGSPQLSAISGYHVGAGLSAGVANVGNGNSYMTINRVTDLESANGWDSSTPWAWGTGDQINGACLYTTS